MASDRLRESIATAKRLLARGDVHLANFMLRDLPETKAAAMSEVSWAMHREGCSENDVLHLIEKLEEWEVQHGE